MTEPVARQKLSADDFAIQGMSGMEVITGFGFDPDKCVVTVDDDGNLVISQEGHRDFTSMASFWDRIA